MLRNKNPRNENGSTCAQGNNLRSRQPVGSWFPVFGFWFRAFGAGFRLVRQAGALQHNVGSVSRVHVAGRPSRRVDPRSPAFRQKPTFRNQEPETRPEGCAQGITPVLGNSEERFSVPLLQNCGVSGGAIRSAPAETGNARSPADSREGFEGFSLIEMLIALTLSTLILGAAFLVFNQAGRWNRDLELLRERDENLRLAPLLFSQWLNPAENQSWRVQGASLQIQGDELHVHSDLDGPDGFPNSSLSESFERVVLRQRSGQLQLRSGTGSFQPVLKNISTLQAVQLNPRLLSVTVEGITETSLSTVGRPDSYPLPLNYHLWNRRPNLFMEQRP